MFGLREQKKKSAKVDRTDTTTKGLKTDHAHSVHNQERVLVMEYLVVTKNMFIVQKHTPDICVSYP